MTFAPYTNAPLLGPAPFQSSSIPDPPTLNMLDNTSIAGRLGRCALCLCIYLFLEVARVSAQDEPRLSNERVVFQASACGRLWPLVGRGRPQSLNALSNLANVETP